MIPIRPHAAGPRQPRPVAVLPGTASKVAVLAARWAAGEALWHPADARLTDDCFKPLAPVDQLSSMVGRPGLVLDILEAARRPLTVEGVARLLEERCGQAINRPSLYSLLNRLARAGRIGQQPGQPPHYCRAAAVVQRVA